jgi:hypothetical protein
MTDKELLELAAKAAGIEYNKNVKYDFGLWLVIHEEPTEFTRRGWNPLTDDGDALRLAVKLNLEVSFDNEPDGSIVCVDSSFIDIPYMIEDLGKDPYAATRRAIVRAAAEIGKNAN